MPAEMGARSSKQKDLTVVVMAAIPRDSAGNCLVDVYVRLPTADKYVRWVKKGDSYSDDKRQKLLNHPDPRLYCPVHQWNERHKFIKLKDSVGPKIGDETKEIITDLFTEILNDNGNIEAASEKLINISKTIASEILSDIESYEKSILAEFKDLKRLEDSYAIRSLCILFSLALGFNSKTAIADITTATIFMDTALLDFTTEELESYYRNPSAMSPAFIDAYKKHPAKSHFMASQKLKKFTEQSLLMILNHHELHNGQGFPRKSQTRSLPDLVRVLAFAVDVFEALKSAELNDTPISIGDAIWRVYEPRTEAHLRRHQTGMMDKVIHFLKVKDQEEKKAS